MKMTYGFLILLLTGCVTADHKHPHDHGLSALKGQIARDSDTIASLTQMYQYAFVEVNAKLDELSNKLAAQSEELEAAENDVVNLQAVAWKYENEMRGAKRMIHWLKEDVKELKEKMKELKPPEQKLIELRPEEDEEEDPPFIGPPWPPLPEVGGEVGEEKD